MAADRLGPLLAQMLGCAESYLTKPVGRVTVMPGTSVVWDDCCDGQLWVRLTGITPSSTGAVKASGQPCLPRYSVGLSLGVIRCAHTLNDQGVPPTPAQMTADAFATFQDRADLIEAVVCCMWQMTEIELLKIEGWTPLGPEGGCIGGELSLSFNHVLCTPC